MDQRRKHEIIERNEVGPGNYYHERKLDEYSPSTTHSTSQYYHEVGREPCMNGDVCGCIKIPFEEGPAATKATATAVVQRDQRNAPDITAHPKLSSSPGDSHRKWAQTAHCNSVVIADGPHYVHASRETTTSPYWRQQSIPSFSEGSAAKKYMQASNLALPQNLNNNNNINSNRNNSNVNSDANNMPNSMFYSSESSASSSFSPATSTPSNYAYKSQQQHQHQPQQHQPTYQMKPVDSGNSHYVNAEKYIYKAVAPAPERYPPMPDRNQASVIQDAKSSSSVAYSSSYEDRKMTTALSIEASESMQAIKQQQLQQQQQQQHQSQHYTSNDIYQDVNYMSNNNNKTSQMHATERKSSANSQFNLYKTAPPQFSAEKFSANYPPNSPMMETVKCEDYNMFRKGPVPTSAAASAPSQALLTNTSQQGDYSKSASQISSRYNLARDCADAVHSPQRHSSTLSGQHQQHHNQQQRHPNSNNQSVGSECHYPKSTAAAYKVFRDHPPLSLATDNSTTSRSIISTTHHQQAHIDFHQYSQNEVMTSTSTTTHVFTERSSKKVHENHLYNARNHNLYAHNEQQTSRIADCYNHHSQAASMSPPNGCCEIKPDVNAMGSYSVEGSQSGMPPKSLALSSSPFTPQCNNSSYLCSSVPSGGRYRHANSSPHSSSVVTSGATAAAKLPSADMYKAASMRGQLQASPEYVYPPTPPSQRDQYCVERTDFKTTNNRLALSHHQQPLRTGSPPLFDSRVPLHHMQQKQQQQQQHHHQQPPPPPLPSQEGFPHFVNASVNSAASLRVQNTATIPPPHYHNPPLAERLQSNNQLQLPQASIQLAATTTGALATTSIATTVAAAAAPSSTSKKSQMPKPNYRELINQVYAMRNATSEDELNRQIIKKTLKVDPQAAKLSERSPPPPPPPPQLSDKYHYEKLQNHQWSGSMSLPDKAPIAVPVDEQNAVLMPRDRLQSVQEQITCTTTIYSQQFAKSSIASAGASANNVGVALPRIAFAPNLSPSTSSLSKSMLAASASSSSPLPAIRVKTEKTIGTPPEPQVHSTPLDLSIRTVKTKADSTDYKYTDTSKTSLPSDRSSTRHITALPKINFFPNFSMHTIASNDSVDKSNSPLLEERRMTSADVKTEDADRYNGRNIMIPRAKIPSFSNPQMYAHQSEVNVLGEPVERNRGHIRDEISGSIRKAPIEQMDFSYESKSASLVGREAGLRPSTQHLRYHRPQNEDNMSSVALQQTRPSVLESNPYAAHKIQKIAAIPAQIADKIPADTNITAFIKSPSIAKCKVEIDTVADEFDVKCGPYTDSVVGQKRHYHKQFIDGEEQPLAKHRRFEDVTCAARGKSIDCITPQIQTTSCHPQASIQIKGHDRFENSQQAAKIYKTENGMPSMPAYEPPMQSVVSTFTPDNAVLVSVKQEQELPICKQEIPSPVTPKELEYRGDPTPPVPKVIATASRIRTKAELKGFTFNPLPPPTQMPSESIATQSPTANAMAQQQLQTAVPIQEDKAFVSSNIPPLVEELRDDFDFKSLTDFSWNSTCSSFMKQLSTSKVPKKPIAMAPIKAEPLSNSNITAEPASMLTVIKSEIVFSPSLPRQLDGPSNGGHEKSGSPQDISFSPGNSSSGPLQKKISKNEREKLRLQQERRIKERLQNAESSSESDAELDRRKSDRQRKPFKVKTNKLMRASVVAPNRKRFSDCGSDSSGTDYEEKIEKATAEAAAAHKHAMSSKMSASKKPTREVADFFSRNTQIPGIMNPSVSEVKSHTLRQPHSEGIHKKPFGSDSSQSNNNGNSKASKVSAVSRNSPLPSAEKPAPKSKNSLNSGAVTVTRSKRRRELEMQLANSKVLRNDKIIRNSTAKIKRKYVRKMNTSHGKPLSTGLDADKKDLSLQSANSSTDILTRTRDRLRKERDSSASTTKLPKGSKHDSKLAGCDGEQTDLLKDLEVYRYKRALKIPPSLIPSNYKIAASLSDLEKPSRRRRSKNKDPSAAPHRMLTEALSDAVKSPTQKYKSLKSGHSESEVSSQHTPLSSYQKPLKPDEHCSIIDLLHSRVIKSTSGAAKKLPAASTSTTISSSSKKPSGCSKTNKPSKNSLFDVQNSARRAVGGEVGIAGDDNANNADSGTDIQVKSEKSKEDGTKKHFSIFDTKVLQTKTRTESKLQRTREIIREIFVGDERPASAPPEMTQAPDEAEKKMTYEQKYEQFLQQMNIVIEADKSRKLGSYRRCTTAHDEITSTPLNTAILRPPEEDTGSISTVDADEINRFNNRNQTINGSGRRFVRGRRHGKYFRRKGSSGFDYIRKKKKHTSGSLLSASAAALSHAISLRNESRCSDDYDIKFKIKTEEDVCREIQKWVLNKGVGQSTMHKAARLGYIDVIVYCLDRLDMNPDQKDNAGYTPLHEACTNGWLEIARILLQYGANHSEAAHSGIRPLHEASENGHEEIVRLLLSYGADPMVATYSGQTPLMLASDNTMTNLLQSHLCDVQCSKVDRQPWRFDGPWKINDPTECGYDVLSGAPNYTCDMSRALQKHSGSNLLILNQKKQITQSKGTNNSKTVVDGCAPVVLNDIGRCNAVSLFDDIKPEIIMNDSDSDGEIFEFEETDVLLPPLYLLKDEGTEKWVLLSDLCNLLKVKSKDTLLNKIYPPSSVSSANKNIMRELKMSDFLEKATCLQLLCAGEKVNVCASKVVLIKYNESVKNLLGVKTILMKF